MKNIEIPRKVESAFLFRAGGPLVIGAANRQHPRQLRCQAPQARRA
jgi:hypothetical protein